MMKLASHSPQFNRWDWSLLIMVVSIGLIIVGLALPSLTMRFNLYQLALPADQAALVGRHYQQQYHPAWYSVVKVRWVELDPNAVGVNCPSGQRVRYAPNSRPACQVAHMPDSAYQIRFDEYGWFGLRLGSLDVYEQGVHHWNVWNQFESTVND